MNKIYTLNNMIKSKLILIVLLQCVFALYSNAQQILLFNENFNETTGPISFTLNGALPTSGNSFGTNQWIWNGNIPNNPGVNYYSNSTLPSTEDEEYHVCVSNEHISCSCPFSGYLHISNANIPSNLNSDYDPAQASQCFAYMTNGVCTMGMDSVALAFFYNCEGSPTAYAQVFYSINGGAAWNPLGLPLQQFNNDSSCWNYFNEYIPAFRDVSSLQVGFLWVNDDNSSDPVVQGMAIDDIFIVGVPKSNLTDSITYISPDTVCINSGVLFQVSLSDTLCEGTYEYQLSDATGNFNNILETYVFSMGAPYINALEYLPIGSNIPPGPCYRIRVVRISPPPLFVGQPSPCIVVENCPTYIYTQQPVVTYYNNTAALCVGSVIDIPFYSYGNYFPGNNYIGELSDSAGNFLSMTIINTNYNDPNAHQGPPGTVSGLVPDVPDGCNYYVRVVGTNPDSTVGTPWGPFCIQHCDINTNEHISLHFCLTPNDTTIDTCLDVDVHTFTNNQQYLAGNKFEIQLLSTMTFLPVIPNGALGYTYATGDTLVCIHIAGIAGMQALGLAPGAYYLRVIATNTLYPDSSLGEVIHFTIGVPPDTGLSVGAYYYPSGDTIGKSHACPGDILEFLPIPYDPNAQYEWYGGFVGDSLNSPDILINLSTGSGFSDFIVWVREIDFGCRGPASNPDTVVIDGVPQVNISSPVFVCLHDTNQWIVPYGQNTYYDWTALGTNTHVLDTSNNTIKIRFDSSGTFTISVFAVNHCGSATGTKTIKVIKYPAILGPINDTVCSDIPIILATPSATFTHYLWSNPDTLSTTDSVTIIPYNSETIILTVTQTQGHCMSFDTIHLNVLQTPVATHNDSLCVGDTLNLIPIHTGANYLWNTGATASHIKTVTGGTFIAVITSPDSLCPSLDTFNVATAVRVVNHYTDSICEGDSATLIATANSGAIYSWNSGSQTTGQIKIDSGGIYVAKINYPNRVCTNLDTFTVVQPSQIINSIKDSTCPGDPLPLTAATQSGATYFWNTGETTQTINVYDSGTYFVYHTVPNQRCADADTFHVSLKNCGQMTLPNVFSPNGDGLNDFFLPITVGVFTTFQIEIYDRWGLKMWQSSDPDFHWPGVNMSGNKCPDGTYYYVINTTYQNKGQEWHGFVTLIR